MMPPSLYFIGGPQEAQLRGSFHYHIFFPDALARRIMEYVGGCTGFAFHRATVLLPVVQCSNVVDIILEFLHDSEVQFIMGQLVYSCTTVSVCEVVE